MTSIFCFWFTILYVFVGVAGNKEDVFSAGLGIYVQDDGVDHTGGNPKLAEDELVFEGIIMLDKSLSDRDRLNVKVLGDIVSSASQMRYHNPQFRALQSNPSGNKHISGDVGYAYSFDKLTLGGHGGFSYEANVYMSWPYGINVSIPMLNNNTVFGLRLDGFTDFFQIKLFDGTMPGFATRQTFSSEANLLQVLTPVDVLNFNLNYTAQFGMLETTYYSVFVNDVEQSEKMPPTRHRGAVSARWKHSLSPRNAFELGYRYYADTWKLSSHTVETRFFQYLYRKYILLEPSVRFYTQTGTYFFQRQFTDLPEFRTSETDLGPFTGSIFGLKLSLIDLPGFPIGINELSVGGNYWLRDDGFRIYWFEIGYLVRF